MEATDFPENVVNMVNSYENIQRHKAGYDSFKKFASRSTWYFILKQAHTRMPNVLYQKISCDQGNENSFSIKKDAFQD
jgi:hypothetical protein